jgi:hypothetical protein
MDRPVFQAGFREGCLSVWGRVLRCSSPRVPRRRGPGDGPRASFYTFCWSAERPRGRWLRAFSPRKKCALQEGCLSVWGGTHPPRPDDGSSWRASVRLGTVVEIGEPWGSQDAGSIDRTNGCDAGWGAIHTRPITNLASITAALAASKMHTTDTSPQCRFSGPMSSALPSVETRPTTARRVPTRCGPQPSSRAA